MKSHVSFTSKFRALNPIPAQHNKINTRDENKEQAELLDILRGDYHENRVFLQQRKEFIAAVNKIYLFLANNSTRTTPPLSASTLHQVEDSFATLRNNLAIDYYADHNAIVYSTGKQLIHKLESLLDDTGIAIENKINTILTLSYSATVCSGGLLTGLQEAVSSLIHLKQGIQGAVFRTKTQLIDYLILQHVNTHHPDIAAGDEVHYCNIYFNYTAKEYGLEAKSDPFLFRAEDTVTNQQFQNLKKNIDKKLNPSLLSNKLAQEYIDKVKALNVTPSHPQNDELIIHELDLNQFTNNLNQAKEAHLDSEYGAVPTDSFLFPVENTNNYRLPQKTTLVATHFLKALKDQDIVNYDDAVTLYTYDNKACVKILGLFLWIDKNGECDELDTSTIFTIPADKMHSQLSGNLEHTDDVNRTLHELLTYIYEKKYVDDINAIPDQWLYGFMALFNFLRMERYHREPYLF